jgi:DNA mismatch repair ATPase MutL
VRFGDELTADAQQRLLDRLVDTPGGLTCPHGRPAVAVFDDAMLRRVFHRPQG